MSNRTYDFMKKLITVFVPAFITLFVALANIWKWNVPVDAIVATITAVTTFIGVMLGISSNVYAKENDRKDEQDPKNTTTSSKME